MEGGKQDEGRESGGGGKPRLALASARSRESPKHRDASILAKELACVPSTKWAPWAQCSLNPQKLRERGQAWGWLLGRIATDPLLSKRVFAAMPVKGH